MKEISLDDVLGLSGEWEIWQLEGEEDIFQKLEVTNGCGVTDVYLRSGSGSFKYVGEYDDNDIIYDVDYYQDLHNEITNADIIKARCLCSSEGW